MLARPGPLVRASWTLLLTLMTGLVSASHISGVDISWTCVGNNYYQVTLNLFRDCSGITMSSTQELDVTSDCGQSFSVTMNQVPGSGQEISQLCTSVLPQSDCNNGGYPGMEHYTYQATVFLFPPCDGWTLAWTDCCRNPSVNVPTSSVDDIYADVTVNTVTAPCNDSPVFTAQPIPFVCLGQPVNYSFGVYDPDGDSLAYTFIDARVGASNSMVYGAGFSGQVPVTGITLDPFTGAVNFTPNLAGNYIVVVQVEEYDDNDQLIGTVMRDMQFTVINCTNTVPDLPPGIANLSGDATQTGPYSLELCLQDQFCLDLVFTDADPNDVLTLSSNVDLVLPGATFVQTGTNPATATICWTAVPGTSTLAAFSVEAEDNACPVTGLVQSTVWVTFLPTTVINIPDTLLCFAEELALLATGGNAFDWTVLSGPPLQVGVNFSCNPCPDPVAMPTETTVYEVTGDLGSATCPNKDTVTVTVVEPFGIDVLAIDSVDCHGASTGSLEVTPWGNAGPPWTYELLQNGTVVQTTTTNGPATLGGLAAGTYLVELSEVQGCVVDSLVEVHEPDELVVTASDTTICRSTQAMVQATWTGGTGTPVLSWDQGLVGNGPHPVQPLVPTDYVVQATDVNGCISATDTASVDLHPALTAVAYAPDSICVDASSTMHVVPGGGIGAPYSFQWTEPGVGTIGTDDTLVHTPAGGSSTFIVSVNDGCGSPTAFDTVQVAWYPPPVPMVAPDKPEDCYPAAISFSNLTPAADVGAYCLWDFGDGTTLTDCGPVQHTYMNVGCYDVTLTVHSPEGCPGTSTFPELVCARPYPVADFEQYPLTANVLDPVVSFLDHSQDAVTWTWSFGPFTDPDSAFVPEPVVRFPEVDEGDYPVWLHVTNIYGCPDSVMKFVHIDGVFSVYVPTAFTPNNDGTNDLFGPQGIGISEEGYSLVVFDRWGQPVFTSTKPWDLWNGELPGGAQAMPGVYSWRLDVVNKFVGQERTQFGQVTLVR